MEGIKLKATGQAYLADDPNIDWERWLLPVTYVLPVSLEGESAGNIIFDFDEEKEDPSDYDWSEGVWSKDGIVYRMVVREKYNEGYYRIKREEI